MNEELNKDIESEIQKSLDNSFEARQGKIPTNEVCAAESDDDGEDTGEEDNTQEINALTGSIVALMSAHIQAYGKNFDTDKVHIPAREIDAVSNMLLNMPDLCPCSVYQSLLSIAMQYEAAKKIGASLMNESKHHEAAKRCFINATSAFFFMLYSCISPSFPYQCHIFTNASNIVRGMILTALERSEKPSFTDTLEEVRAEQNDDDFAGLSDKEFEL